MAPHRARGRLRIERKESYGSQATATAHQGPLGLRLRAQPASARAAVQEDQGPAPPGAAGGAAWRTPVDRPDRPRDQHHSHPRRYRQPRPGARRRSGDRSGAEAAEHGLRAHGACEVFVFVTRCTAPQSHGEKTRSLKRGPRGACTAHSQQIGQSNGTTERRVDPRPCGYTRQSEAGCATPAFPECCARGS